MKIRGDFRHQNWLIYMFNFAKLTLLYGSFNRSDLLLFEEMYKNRTVEHLYVKYCQMCVILN